MPVTTVRRSPAGSLRTQLKREKEKKDSLRRKVRGFVAAGLFMSLVSYVWSDVMVLVMAALTALVTTGFFFAIERTSKEIRETEHRLKEASVSRETSSPYENIDVHGAVSGG